MVIFKKENLVKWGVFAPYVSFRFFLSNRAYDIEQFFQLLFGQKVGKILDIIGKIWGEIDIRDKAQGVV